jgi:predicted transcriptional regulator
VKKNPQKQAVSETLVVEVLEEAAADAKIKRRKKDTKPAAVSLEAHQATSSSSDVSILFARASEYAVVALLSLPFPSASDAEVFVPWHRVS